MAKNVFCICWLNIFLSVVPVVAAANPAAKALAARIYQMGNRHMQTSQWEKARQAYTIAVLLDPFFEEAAAGKKKEMDLLRPSTERRGAQTGNREPKTESPVFQKMLQIKNHLERGERAEAVLALTELLRDDPQNERAKLLLEKLEAEDRGVYPENPKFKEAEALFKQAKQTETKGDKLLSYRLYTQTFNFFSQEELKPYFYKELTERIGTLEGELSAELEQKLRNLGKGDPEKIGRQLRDFESRYPLSQRLQTMLKALYDTLQAKALPLLLSAKTLQALEGCKASVDQFATVQTIALFPEVPAWGEAQKNIGACQYPIRLKD